MPKTPRALTKIGRNSWAEFIASAKKEPTLKMPQNILDGKDETFELSLDFRLEQRAFVSKFEMAEYLFPLVKQASEQRLDEETLIGMWDWLAAYFFDTICPIDDGGRRTVKEVARYIYDPRWNRKYRHRVAEPCGLYERHGDSAHIFLYGPPSQISDMEEQASSRLAINSNKGVSEALMQLYWDPDKNRPKVRAADTKRSPGSLRRFSDILLQLELTYDLESIGRDGIVELLPKKEFEPWMIS